MNYLAADGEVSGAPKPVTVELGDRVVHLVGTAHVSQRSVEEVRDAIRTLSPDRVAVELDPKRLEALRNPNRWKELDLVSVIRDGKGGLLLSNLLLMSFQRRLGLGTGVLPGAELAEAVTVAEELGKPVDLVDRDVRVTLLRVWRRTGFWKKLALMGALVESVFDDQAVDEEELEKLRDSDTLSALLEEMGKALPSAKTVLIDERDVYMAERIRALDGQTVVAVVGAGHLPGIARSLREGSSSTPAELEVIPPKPSVSKVIPWVIPALVLGLFVWGFFRGDTSRLQEAAVAWVLANGILSALGAILALGHPLAVIAAFVAAPITSLNPTIGAGMVSGLVQAWARKPLVRDLEGLGDDLTRLRGWWSNRVSRTLLVFVFSSLGSSVGTFVAFGWLKNLL